jgi:hypothetical protein
MKNTAVTCFLSVLAGTGHVGCAAGQADVSFSIDDDDEGGKADSAGPKLRAPTAADRAEYIRKAAIWENTDPEAIPTRDLFVGPTSDEVKGALSPYEPVTCRFVEPQTLCEPPGGATPKFMCTQTAELVTKTCADGTRKDIVQDEFKVKYSRDQQAASADGQLLNSSLPDNGEVYGTVMATRLFYALGVYTSSFFPTQLTCENCPDRNPWDTYGGASYNLLPGPRPFYNAVIERKLSGKTVEVTKDQGWTWDKDFPMNEAPSEQKEALKLLAAFVYHGDSKPDNQRLVCQAVDEKGMCTKSVMMIGDLGSTFGGNSCFLHICRWQKADLAKWSHDCVWKDPAQLRARLTSPYPFQNPTISPEGVQFLAERLSRLKPQQVADIFRASRIAYRKDPPADAAQEEAVVQAWVNAFQAKVDQVVNRTCPAN